MRGMFKKAVISPIESAVALSIALTSTAFAQTADHEVTITARSLDTRNFGEPVQQLSGAALAQRHPLDEGAQGWAVGV